MVQKCILFDLDGTLTDSGEGIISCVRRALKDYGFPEPDDQTMRTFIGPPLRDTFLRFGVPAQLVDEVIRHYRSYYVPEGMFQNYPYPGMEDLLKRLKDEGHRLFVATSKPHHMSVAILERFGLAPYFERICGAAVDGMSGSKEAVIASQLAHIGSAENVIMVGDTVYDVLGAAAFHIPTIGVSWGYGEIPDMEKAGAKAIAHTMDELYALLTE